jgi:S1-C subfamily serine protease
VASLINRTSRQAIGYCLAGLTLISTKAVALEQSFHSVDQKPALNSLVRSSTLMQLQKFVKPLDVSQTTAQLNTSDPLILQSETNFDSAYLGISARTCRDLNGLLATQVTSISEHDSPFAGKLLRGDFMLSYNGVNVTNASMLTRLIESTIPNSEIDLVIARDRKIIEITERSGLSRKIRRFYENPPAHPPACE